MIPGNPIPTASNFSPLATDFACAAIVVAISSAGIASNASCVEPFSGNERTPPTTLLPSTSPAEILCTTWTPTNLPMTRLPFPTPFRNSLLHLCQFVQSVECGRFVALGQRRIVEHGVHKIFHRPLQRQHSLSDVQELRRAFANNVHTQQLFRIRAENQLQSSGCVSANLSARNLSKVCDADLVRHSGIGQLILRLPDKRNLWNRIDPIWIVRRVGVYLHARSVCSRNSSLFHGNRTQAWKPNHVSHRVNVRHGSAVFRIHLDSSARIGFQSRRRQIQFIHISLPAYCIQ